MCGSEPSVDGRTGSGPGPGMARCWVRLWTGAGSGDGPVPGPGLELSAAVYGLLGNRRRLGGRGRGPRLARA